MGFRFLPVPTMMTLNDHNARPCRASSGMLCKSEWRQTRTICVTLQGEWPLIGFQSYNILQYRISWKRCNTELYLQWQADSKSCMIYLMLPSSVTLNDP